MHRFTRQLTAITCALLLVAAGCGGSDAAVDSTEPADGATQATADSTGLRLVSAGAAATILEDPPADLVVLDVRTPEEFGEGHIEGAVMLDFYRDDFAAELAELDPDVPYLLYCRSGNRSGQTIAMMADLGFEDVADVNGGILAWDEAGLDKVGG